MNKFPFVLKLSTRRSWRLPSNSELKTTTRLRLEMALTAAYLISKSTTTYQTSL